MTVRLATYNLLHGMTVLGGVPAPLRDDAGRIVGPPLVADDVPLRAAVAELDADVIGLQEVDVDQPRSGGAHQVRSVAEAMGAEHWRFAPSVAGTPGEDGWRHAEPDHETAANPRTRRVDPEQRRRSGDGGTGVEVDPPVPVGPLYGVGLVSRLPVTEWRTTRFDPAPWSLPLLIPAEPRPRWISVPDEPRAAIAAVVEGHHGPFTVATAHLSFVPGYNVKQLRELRRWLAGLPRPLVLLGDFNLPGRIPAMTTGWHPLVRAATYPVTRPRAQLDHVLVDGFPAAGLEAARATAAVPRLPVSDPAAVTGDLDL
ncbi:MAG: endonuclease/exonuclease/phosphatase family protein [Candidatus Nanopelagicales bacterium]